ncbi:MAG: hypothetical protein OMM_08211 [Candidatus Magnetoglobus multicellularis str. Araruama]|uniref:Pyruvate phosphate dikinase AMP/ATP-binding domain-containing protein n=1 Tax=Candidatus Magnetoglobus multicellularis str. Araruama TaxID=890399 RepID=A0A1V1P923_9BACT|nr:MAG: hypothetical protein OMM_08211 [Candidatus Magnetoglobus multicellularis str. Araruama]
MPKIYHIKKQSSIPDVSQIGGKAKNLATLSTNKIHVPQWMVLTAEFFESFVNKDIKTIDTLLSTPCPGDEDIVSVSKKITDIIDQTEFDAGLKESFESEIQSYFDHQHSFFL